MGVTTQVVQRDKQGGTPLKSGVRRAHLHGPKSRERLSSVDNKSKVPSWLRQQEYWGTTNDSTGAQVVDSSDAISTVHKQDGSPAGSPSTETEISVTHTNTKKSPWVQKAHEEMAAQQAQAVSDHRSFYHMYSVVRMAVKA